LPGLAFGFETLALREILAVTTVGNLRSDLVLTAGWEASAEHAWPLPAGAAAVHMRP
jgi:hypothetical protein